LLASLVFGSVLSGTLLIPALRPFMALRAPGNESATHAFMSLSLLGAVVAAPFVSRLSRAVGNTTLLVTTLALLDAASLAWLSIATNLHVLLAVRTLQGALNLSVLSLLMGAAPSGDARRLGARYGLLGAAVMLGVALGAPLGSLCLRFGPAAALRFGALVEVVVAIGLPFAGLLNARVRATAAAPSALPWVPMLWAFTERLAVGLFVVTFAFHAKSCLGVSDQYVGWLLSAFMLPFVVTVYPAGRLSDRVGPTPIAVAGLTLYGFCWLALGAASVSEAPVVLLLLGTSSAAVFAAGLRISGGVPDVTTRIAAMSALNSAGSLGMLVGTATAGILSAVLRRHGAGPHAVHDLVLHLAGAAQMSAAVVTAAMVLLQRRSLRLVRS
jgi:MFS family permease